MEITKIKTTKGTFFDRLLKQLITILAILLVVTVGINLWLLTDLGTRGSELSSLRSQQEEVKIKNDLYRSKLESLKVNSLIESTAINKLKLSEKKVTVVDLTADISAQHGN